MSDIVKLPDADHVEGAILTKAANWRLSTVEIQYRNAASGLCSLTMTAPNALYLLNLLQQMAKDHDYEKYLKPPGA